MLFSVKLNTNSPNYYWDESEPFFKYIDQDTIGTLAFGAEELLRGCGSREGGATDDTKKGSFLHDYWGGRLSVLGRYGGP